MQSAADLGDIAVDENDQGKRNLMTAVPGLPTAALNSSVRRHDQIAGPLLVAEFPRTAAAAATTDWPPSSSGIHEVW